MADGIFQVKELIVSLSEAEFLIECGVTAYLKDCGQPTAKGFALRFGGESMSLEELKQALGDVLSRIPELEARAELRSEVRAANRSGE